MAITLEDLKASIDRANKESADSAMAIRGAAREQILAAQKQVEAANAQKQAANEEVQAVREQKFRDQANQFAAQPPGSLAQDRRLSFMQAGSNAFDFLFPQLARFIDNFTRNTESKADKEKDRQEAKREREYANARNDEILEKLETNNEILRSVDQKLGSISEYLLELKDKAGKKDGDGSSWLDDILKLGEGAAFGRIAGAAITALGSAEVLAVIGTVAAVGGGLYLLYEVFKKFADEDSVGMKSSATRTTDTGQTVNPQGQFATVAYPPAGGGGAAPAKDVKKNVAAASKMTTEEAALLNMVAGKESGGDYGAINYVARAKLRQGVMGFSGAEGHHPFEGQKGTTAAGRYQFIWSTWKKATEIAGTNASDFSPENQDITAIRFIKYKYNKSGGNFDEDIKDPSKIQGIINTGLSDWSVAAGGNAYSTNEFLRSKANTEKLVKQEAEKTKTASATLSTAEKNVLAMTDPLAAAASGFKFSSTSMSPPVVAAQDSTSKPDIAASAMPSFDTRATENAPAAETKTSSDNAQATKDTTPAAAPAVMSSLDTGATKNVAPAVMSSLDTGATKNVAPAALPSLDTRATKGAALKSASFADQVGERSAAKQFQNIIATGGGQSTQPAVDKAATADTNIVGRVEPVDARERFLQLFGHQDM